MAFQLLDVVKGYITPNLINSAANQFGESSNSLTKATSAALPALLGGFINKAETGGATELLNDAKHTEGSGLLGRLGSLFGGEDSSVMKMGTSLLNSVFGAKLGSVINSISNFAGISNASASSFLSLLAPLSLGALGKHVVDNNISESGFTNLLSSQKDTVMNALPSGLGLSSLFDGFSSSAAGKATTAYEASSKRNFTWPVLLSIGGIVLLGFLLSRGCSNEKQMVAANTNVDTTVAVSMPESTNTSVAMRESVKVILKDGTEINAYKGGIEDRLVTCLNDAACRPGKDLWFDFDNINFETGSANLTPESDMQVRNIVAILKAYSNAKIKIGGYTDKTGDAAANKKLSQQRAETILNALKLSGANTSQLMGAEGYGSEFAKIDASASDEERRSDRRIAVQLREK